MQRSHANQVSEPPKHNVVCLSGWGQKADSLELIFKESADQFSISSLDYSPLSNVEAFFSNVKSKNLDPKILIGWSLGGQLAIRLIEKQILSPQLLVLIAPPFQMVKDSRIQAGMPKIIFNEFYKKFSDAPTEALKTFTILTAMHDSNFSQIVKTLHVSDKNFTGLQFWLEELERFSCFDIDFSKMPKTLYFQGAGDKITHASQVNYFKDRIQNFHFEIFKNCGHAPHLHDLTKVRSVILEEFGKVQ